MKNHYAHCEHSSQLGHHGSLSCGIQVVALKLHENLHLGHRIPQQQHTTKGHALIHPPKRDHCSLTYMFYRLTNNNQ